MAGGVATGGGVWSRRLLRCDPGSRLPAAAANALIALMTGPLRSAIEMGKRALCGDSMSRVRGRSKLRAGIGGGDDGYTSSSSIASKYVVGNGCEYGRDEDELNRLGGIA